MPPVRTRTANPTARDATPLTRIVRQAAPKVGQNPATMRVASRTTTTAMSQPTTSATKNARNPAGFAGNAQGLPDSGLVPGAVGAAGGVGKLELPVGPGLAPE